MVCCLLLVDAFVVTFWTLSDPMERHLKNLTLEISLTDRSVVYQPQVRPGIGNYFHLDEFTSFLIFFLARE